MARYAVLEAPLTCPTCHTCLTDLLWFQWGYCKHSTPRGDFYHFNDAIQWRSCSDGTLSAWAYSTDDGSANIGAPSVQYVLVREEMYGFERIYSQTVGSHPGTWPLSHDFQKVSDGCGQPSDHQSTCPVCGKTMGGAMIEIRNSTIIDAWVYRPGDFDYRVDYYLIAANGQTTPVPEWNDQPMDRVQTC